MDDLVDCLNQQNAEVEMLRSMYPSEDELKLDIPNLWETHERLMANSDFSSFASQGLIPCWSFELRIHADECTISCAKAFVTAHFSLPLYYPLERASVYVESDLFPREKQGLMNNKLKSFIASELPASEQVVLPVIDWIRENMEEYFHSTGNASSGFEGKTKSTERKGQKSIQFCVMWLYMHHIYSKEKRRNILKWAQERRLTGFSMPGKPGVVYVEGSPDDVNEYFVKLRRLNWQKMSCKQRDTFEVQSMEQARKFQEFKELVLDVHENHGYHMDMGQFREFLMGHDLEYIFEEIFSTKGKTDD